MAQFQIFTIITCFQSLERDPNINLPPPVLGGFSPTIIGEQPPDFVGMDDICPPVQNSIQNVLSYHYDFIYYCTILVIFYSSIVIHFSRPLVQTARR